MRVNNREYSTGETAYANEDLARNAAATQAYMICRNFSVNDGMLPGARPGMAATADVVCQGLPVAIGAGRHRRPTDETAPAPDVDSSSSGGSTAGLSPPSVIPSTRRYVDRRAAGAGLCYCRRAQATPTGRCGFCLREMGYA